MRTAIFGLLGWVLSSLPSTHVTPTLGEYRAVISGKLLPPGNKNFGSMTTVKAHLHCQFDHIRTHLGEPLRGKPVRAFPENYLRREEPPGVGGGLSLTE